MKRFAITGNRQSKVASEIKKSVAGYFQEFSSQFYGVIITITDAEVSADLKEVRVYYNIFSNPDEAKIFEKNISGLLPEILHRISKDVLMKTLPKNIHFIKDDAVGNIKNFETILKSERNEIYKKKDE